MPLTSSIGDISSLEPKVPMTTKTWELNINPMIIRGEVCKIK
jgi:hypothetical protein